MTFYWKNRLIFFQPDIAALSDEAAAERLKKRYTGKTKILAGEAGLLEWLRSAKLTQF